MKISVTASDEKKSKKNTKNKNFGALKWDVWDHFEESTMSCHHCDYVFKGKPLNYSMAFRMHIISQHRDKLSEEDRVIAEQYKERRNRAKKKERAKQKQ